MAAPPLWAWLLLLGGGVALATQKKPETAQPPEGGPGPSPAPVPTPTLDLAPLRELAVFRRRPERLSIVGYLVEAWREMRLLSEDEIATLLAIAYRESGYKLDAISGPNAPDAAVGDAHSLFQITGETAAGLGVDIRQLLPWGDPNTARVSEAELRRASAYNGWAAVRFLNQKPRWSRPSTFREATLAKYPGDPFAVARQYFTSWAGGVGRTWESIADVPVNDRPGSLGYIHVTILHKMEVLGPFRQALGLGPLRSIGALRVSEAPHGAMPGSPLWLHRAVLNNWPISDALWAAAVERHQRATLEVA